MVTLIGREQVKGIMRKTELRKVQKETKSNAEEFRDNQTKKTMGKKNNGHGCDTYGILTMLNLY